MKIRIDFNSKEIKVEKVSIIVGDTRLTIREVGKDRISINKIDESDLMLDVITVTPVVKNEIQVG